MITRTLNLSKILENSVSALLFGARGLGNPLIAVEIKSNEAPDESDIRGLKTFATFAVDYPKAKLFCFYATPRSYKIKTEKGFVQVLPWQAGILLLQGL